MRAVRRRISVSHDEHRHVNWRPRFRSFRSKLMLLVALAVSVPALLTCVILGIQLDRQARTLFANTLNASLETFSLILQANERNLHEGLTRAATDNTLQITLDLEIKAQLTKYIETQRQVLRIAFFGVYDRTLHEGLTRAATDNTLQITLDLEIKAQLTKYIETQRQVLRIAFFGVYDRTFKNIAFSGEQSTGDEQWSLVASGKYGDNCVVTLQIEQQLIKCNGTMFLVSVVPVKRPEDVNRGA